MRKNIVYVFRAVGFLVLVLLMLMVLNRIFFYRDKSVWSTDSRVKTYKELPENSIDILFLGSSNIMSGVNPLQLWEETGLQAYDYCSRAQTFAFSYAYLLDALKTQSPHCVVLDAYSVLAGKECNGLIDTDFHFGVNMDNLSMNSKLELLKNYVSREERLLYLFPLLKNHNYYRTWENTEDETDKIFMGFCFTDAVQPYETPTYTDAVRQMDETDRIYLEKIINLCRQEDIELFVIKTPVVCSDGYHSVLNDVRQMCETYDVAYYDMAEDAAEWGFDYSRHMLDEYHVNKDGAGKVTARLGEILKEKYKDLEGGTDAYAWVWEKEYERMKLSVSNIAWTAEQDEQVYEIMEKHGFSGLEIAPTRIFPQRPYENPAAAAKWAGELKSGHDFTISSMQSIWYGVQEKLFGTDAERKYLTAYTKKAIDFAAAVKCANLVFGCPKNRCLLEGADEDTAVPFFRELGEYALLHGAVIAMEANPPVYNTNYINTTWQAMELAELVHSDGFRVNLDTGTMLENKEPLVWLEGNIKMIHHVHISEPGLGKVQERPLHRELAELLKAENYQGFVSVEMGRREHISEIEEVCGYVKEIFG